MKKALIVFTCLCLYATCVRLTFAVERGGQTRGKVERRHRKPPSQRYKQIKLDESVVYRLPPLAPQSLPDAKGKNGRLQTGVVRALSLDLSVNARWFDLGARGRAAVLGIVSTGAVAVRVHFADVRLPAGAQLFVRSLKNGEEVYGPYEGRGLSADGSFWTPPVKGEGVVIEYLNPHGRTQAETKAVPFRITEVSHEFRD